MNNISLSSSDAMVDIAVRSLCTQSRSRYFGGELARMDHVTRNALAVRNNEAHGQGNGRQSFHTVLRYH